MNHKFKNPPLIEAVFECHFATSEWNSITPGLFFNEVKERFPKISQGSKGFGFSMGQGNLKFGGNNVTLFENPATNTTIQLTENVLSINKLPKYVSWEDYLKDIKFAMESLKKVVKIAAFRRFDLHTLNKIDIGNLTEENFKKYFKIYPVLPEEIIHNSNSIQLDFEFPLVEKREFLKLNLRSLIKEKGYDAPILFSLYKVGLVNNNINYLEWLDEAHSLLHKTFIDSLTEEAINSFDND